MSRLVLHAGMAKTGTTAVQSFVWANREQLTANGLTYCTGFRRRNHAELAVAFSSTVTPLTKAEGVGAGDERLDLRRRLPAMLGDPDAAPAYLASSEHLSTLVRQQSDIDDLAELLRSLYDEVTVVVVVRRADYWTPSAYVEAVKAGDRRPFNADFIARRWFVLDHQAMFSRWGEAFGAENVHAVTFLESDKADARRLPARVLTAAGLPTEVMNDWPLPPRVANLSLSAYATELLRRVNNDHQGADAPMSVISRRGRVVSTRREHWPGPGPVLTPEAAAELTDRGWLRTGIEQTTYAAGDGWAEWAGQPDAPTAPLVDVADEDVERLTALLRRQDLLPDPRWNRFAPKGARRFVRKLLRL